MVVAFGLHLNSIGYYWTNKPTMGKPACDVHSKAADPYVHACAERLCRVPPPVTLPSLSSSSSSSSPPPRPPPPSSNASNNGPSSALPASRGPRAFAEPAWLNDIRPSSATIPTHSLPVFAALLFGDTASQSKGDAIMSRNKPPGMCRSLSNTSASNAKMSPSFASADKNGRIQPHSIINTAEPYDMVFKVMLVGDSGVGKSCLLIRFRDGAFLGGTFISTVGIDFRNKVVAVDNIKVKLQIWDTAGQERFRSVTHAYYRDAHALLLLYDVSNKASFDNTRAWLGEINEYAQDDVVIMLIGNKADKATERQVRYEDGERLSREYGVAFMETSAKTGMNVELAFMAVARDLKYRKTRNPDEPKFNVTEYVQQESEKTSSGCCS